MCNHQLLAKRTTTTKKTFSVTKTKECREREGKKKKKKKPVLFLLLENPRPLSLLQEPQTFFSSSGTSDFLSTCLGIDSQRSAGERMATLPRILGLPWCLSCKESCCNVGDLGLSPGLGKSPGEGKVYPLQYSALENSMDCIVHGVAKSWT